MNKTCLIILSYVENPDSSLLLNFSKQSNYIICADGGQIIAKRNHIVPDCVIGDFDSSNNNKFFNCKYITYPAEKDLTDTEASIYHALQNNFTDIVLYGGIGGRLDHTLGNVSLLLKFYSEFHSIRFLDKHNEMQILHNNRMKLLSSSDYPYFSLITIEEKAFGITTEGAKYNLDNETLYRASTRGISNEIINESVQIEVTNGTLLVVRSADA